MFKMYVLCIIETHPLEHAFSRVFWHDSNRSVSIVPVRLCVPAVRKVRCSTLDPTFSEYVIAATALHLLYCMCCW